MNRLKELREERNLSLRDLENIIGVNYSTIRNYEQEFRDISTDMLKKFADFYEVTIDYLLGYSGYYIYVNYDHGNLLLKINEEYYKELVKDKFIYFNNNHRYIDFNKLIGINTNNDIGEFIIDVYRFRRVENLFNKDSVSIEKLKEIDSSYEVVLSKEFVEFLKECINFNK